MSEILTPPPADAPPERPREKRAEKIVPALEALLFSSARPVKKKDLAEALEATPEAVDEALRLIAEAADRPERGVRLESVADGWRFVTRPEYDAMLERLSPEKPPRYSRAVMETLAIIAYRQPITLPEIQEIRGVNSASVLNTLFEKKLISTAGRRSVVGSPFLYRTTSDFLVRFGLKDVDDLPQPEELAEDLAATVGEAPLAGLPEAISAAAVEEDEEEEDDELFDEEDDDSDEAAEDDGEDET
jgi:segregation and condensation protein B